MAYGYRSTACRVGDHESCQERPIVRCDCECHTDDEDAGESEGNLAAVTTEPA